MSERKAQARGDYVNPTVYISANKIVAVLTLQTTAPNLDNTVVQDPC